MAEEVNYKIEYNIIKDRLTMLREFLKNFYPNSDIFYSQKTNNLPAIAQVMLQENCGVEVVSYNELLAALEDGFASSKIIYNGVCKSYSNLEFALLNNIFVNIDSLNELKQIIGIKNKFNIKKVNIGLRIQHLYQGNNKVLYNKESRFGLSISEALIAYSTCKENSINIKGLHFSLGSNVDDYLRYIMQIDKTEPLINEISKSNSEEECFYLNIGGGIPCSSLRKDYKLSLQNIYLPIIEHIKKIKINQTIKVILEPGRFLFEEAGFLEAQIIDIKEVNEENIIFVNTSIVNINSAHTWYHGIQLANNQNAIQNLDKKYKIAGFNCFEVDYLSFNWIPKFVPEIGNKLTFTNVGAYDIMASHSWIRENPKIQFCLDDKNILDINYRKHKSNLTLPVEIKINEAICLRKVKLEDAVSIFNIIEENRELFSKTMDWVKYTKSYRNSENFILLAADSFNQEEEYTYCMLYQNKIVGMFSLRREGNNFAIGYNLDCNFSGKGIVTTSVKEVTRYLKDNNICNRIYIRCSVSNIKSNAVAKRSGYQLIGILPKGEVINNEYYDQNIYVNL